MPARNARAALGAFGEDLARRHLEAFGYAHVASNWHCRAGELDLVMLDGDTLVFVEVKARRGERAGRAEEAISPAKARKLLAAGEWFVADHPAYQECIWRCDLVAITIRPEGPADIVHYVNAIVDG
jgi:putative endonuclease